MEFSRTISTTKDTIEYKHIDMGTTKTTQHNFIGSVWTVAPEHLASYDYQHTPSTPGQLPVTSRGVCFYLNITAQTYA